jgi:hypothetical protein
MLPCPSSHPPIWRTAPPRRRYQASLGVISDPAPARWSPYATGGGHYSGEVPRLAATATPCSACSIPTLLRLFTRVLSAVLARCSQSQRARPYQRQEWQQPNSLRPAMPAKALLVRKRPVRQHSVATLLLATLSVAPRGPLFLTWHRC